MTAAMAQGKDLILTPGVYDLDQPIVVPHPDTVVLGLGLATLVPQHGAAAMIVVSNSGVKLSGLIIDAGPVNSPVLLSVGTGAPGDASDPDLIQDVFFRVGGAETTPSQDGYPAFLIRPDVTTFQGYGLGSYCFFNQGVTIKDAMSFQVPDTSGVQFHGVFTRFLSGSGSINSVINGTGAAVTSAAPGPSDVVTYP